LYHANKIGVSTGTGLTQIRPHSYAYTDNKSKPKDHMPKWWISSIWIPSKSDDENDNDDKDDNGDEDGNDDEDNNGDDDDNDNNDIINDEHNDRDDYQ
jgi:hypothetical protein